MDTLEVEAPVSFRLVERAIVLSDRRAQTPLVPVQYGDVAQVGLRFIARAYPTGGNEPMAWGGRLWEPDEDVTKTERIIGTDWDQVIQARLEDLAGSHKLGAPEPTEIEKFQTAWPIVSEFIGLKRVAASVPRFDCGVIYYPKMIEKLFCLGPERWRAWTDTHASGAFGLHGEFVDGLSITPQLRWTMWEQPIAVANTFAIMQGSGGVQSRFAFDDDRFPKPPQYLPRPQRYVDVVTSLSPRGNRTLARVVT